MHPLFNFARATAHTTSQRMLIRPGGGDQDDLMANVVVYDCEYEASVISFYLRSQKRHFHGRQYFKVPS